MRARPQQTRRAMGVAERREREKEARRIAIVDAAESVFFEQGVEGARMKDVADRAELSKGLLYVYFADKEDLVHAVASRGLALLEEALHAAYTSVALGIHRVRALAEAYIRFAADHPDYFALILWVESLPFQEAEAGSYAAACQEQADRLIDFCAKAIETGTADGSIRPDVDPRAMAVIEQAFLLTRRGLTRGADDPATA